MPARIVGRGSYAGLDEVIAATWPAPESEELDGWRLRFGHGLTGRANSAWPRRHGVDSLLLDEKIARVESYYRERGLRPKLQLSPASEPPDLDEELAARGYERSVEVLIETAAALVVDAGAVVRLTSEPDERWLAIWLAVRGFPRERAPHVLPMLRGPDGETVFASLGDVAIGRAAAHGGWVAITSMATLPEARRKGSARAILAALAKWAGERGAPLCLNVEATNGPARALYESAGFEPVSGYWYRTLPV